MAGTDSYPRATSGEPHSTSMPGAAGRVKNRHVRRAYAGLSHGASDPPVIRERRNPAFVGSCRCQVVSKNKNNNNANGGSNGGSNSNNSRFDTDGKCKKCGKKHEAYRKWHEPCKPCHKGGDMLHSTPRTFGAISTESQRSYVSY